MADPGYHIDRFFFELMGVSLPVLIFLIVGAAAFAVWYYRDTVPPVIGWKKWALVTTRATALALIFISLAKPVLNIIATVTHKSTIAVLIDTSSSMDQTNDPARKTDALDALGKIRSKLGKDGTFFSFDTHISDLEQIEPLFSGSGTDLLNAIQAVKKYQDVSSILLISDGSWNLGENPAGTNLPVDIPLNTITVGSKYSLTDVVINNISAAPVGHDNSNLPVEIFITSTHELSDPVPVEITENNIVLASGSVSFRKGTMARVMFDIPLRGPGDHIFSAIIKPRDDDYSENNIRSFGVHVVKSFFHVLIAADTPSADLAFMKRVIEREDAFDLDITVDRGVTGELNSLFPDDISGFDALILINWGGSSLTPQKTESLIKWLSAGGSLWIIGSLPPNPGTDSIVNCLPVTFSNTGSLQDIPFYLELTEVGSTHFVTSQDANNERAWNILPPLNSILPVSKISAGGQILAKAVIASTGDNTLPAMVTGKHGSGKILVMPLSGIWRWQLMMEGAGKGSTFFNNFVTGAINWLTSETETSPLTVTTDFSTYLGGQEINFEARLFDNIYSPVSGADISLVIDNDPTSKIIFRELKPAVYTGVLRGIEKGRHGFRAVAFRNGKLFAESSGNFDVQDFSLEMLDPAFNPDLMKTIAERTGGINVTPSGIDSILTRIQPELRSERHEDKHLLHINPLMPLLIVLLLTVEWGIRKYRGMI